MEKNRFAARVFRRRSVMWCWSASHAITAVPTPPRKTEIVVMDGIRIVISKLIMIRRNFVSPVSGDTQGKPGKKHDRSLPLHKGKTQACMRGFLAGSGDGVRGAVTKPGLEAKVAWRPC